MNKIATGMRKNIAVWGRESTLRKKSIEVFNLKAASSLHIQFYAQFKRKTNFVFNQIQGIFPLTHQTMTVTFVF